MHHGDMSEREKDCAYTDEARRSSQYMYFAIYFILRTLAFFFVAMYRQWAVQHCSELSRAIETGIIQRNKIGRDGQYETEHEFYSFFTFIYKNFTTSVKLNSIVYYTRTFDHIACGLFSLVINMNCIVT